LVTACKSDVSTTYDAGPIADPWMMLAEMVFNVEVCSPYFHFSSSFLQVFFTFIH